MNTTERYKEFPYLSLCGRETNYIRCDDTPIVYTQLVQRTGKHGSTYVLVYNNGRDKMCVDFEPENLCMLPSTGRVYYPASSKTGGVGLVKSALAIDFSKHFEFHNPGGDQAPPTHFNWDGNRYTLTNEIVSLLKNRL